MCSSDARLKQNITDLATTTLDQLMLLNPVTYNWKNESATSSTHTGFIAQDVLKVFPDLVGTDINGMYNLNYGGFTPYLTASLQQVNRRLETIASSSASSTPDSLLFAESFFHSIFTRVTQWLADASNGIGTVFAKAFHAKEEICVDDQCLTKDDVRTLLQMAHNQSAAAASSGSGTTSGSSTPPPPPPAAPVSSSAPIISVNGNNPATINVGDSYADLGATITGPTADLNLGIQTLLDGATTTSIVIDTSVPGTHTIEYRAYDQDGGMGSATRTVTVQQPASTTPPPSDSSSSTPPTDASTSTPATP